MNGLHGNEFEIPFLKCFVNKFGNLHLSKLINFDVEKHVYSTINLFFETHKFEKI